MNNVIIGFATVFQFGNLLMILVGVVAGIAIGALPGLSATMGVVLLLPLTFSMTILPSLMLLLGVYCGAIYGGSISAILIRTPGTPAAAATVFDGNQMALKGEGGRALGAVTVASGIGGLVSCVLLVTFAPILSKFALKFSAAEYFSLGVFGLTIIGSVSGKSLVKGLFAGVLGLFLATVGIDNMSMTVRYTMGSIKLTSGFAIIPLMIGLFAIKQAIEGLQKGSKDIKIDQKKVTKVVPTKEDLKKIIPTSLVFGTVGTFIGAVPGTGGAIAAFIAYSEARRWSKHPEKFGTGIVEGIAAPESANNGVTGGALIPLLTLGVPGDVTTAVLIGAFLIQGLQVGPLLFRDHLDIVYSIFIGFLIINIVMLVVGLLGQKFFIRVVSVPRYIIIPSIFVLCVVGAYGMNNNMFDVWVMLIFGIVGYFFYKLDIPEAPVVIGVILGPMVEANLRQAMIISKGDFSVFFRRPISLVFLLLALLSVFWPIFSKKYGQKVIAEFENREEKNFEV